MQKSELIQAQTSLSNMNSLRKERQEFYLQNYWKYLQYYREIKWDQINSPVLAIFFKPRKFAVRKRIKLHAMHSVENFVYISHKIICLSWEMWKILKPYLNFTWKVGIRAFSWARVRLEIACRDNISVAFANFFPVGTWKKTLDG